MDIGVLDIVGNTDVWRDLHHPAVPGKNGKPRRRILFVLGGGKAGIVSAERLHVLSEAGIPAERFDLIVGISAGAFNAVAFGAGQTNLLREMYLFFSTMPYLVWDQVYELVCEMEKRFDRAHFERHAPDTLIGVSDNVGRLSLHPAKRAHNLFGLLYTAAAIPPFASGRLASGDPAFDGAFAHPCPIREALRAMRGSWEADDIDIVLLANRPRPEHLPFSDIVMFWWGVNVFLRMWAPHLCVGANAIDAKVASIIPLFEKKRVRSRFRTAAWFPTRATYLSPIEWNPATIERVANSVRSETARFIEMARPVQWV